MIDLSLAEEMKDEDVIKVYYTNFERPWSDENFNRLMGCLPKRLQERVMKEKEWELRHGSLARKLLLLHGLRDHGLETDGILEKVKTTASGKPYIEGAPKFNLSNDGTWAVCCMNTDSELGIDLERIKPINLSDYQSQMTYLEWREIYSHVIPLRRFYEFWTIKESVIKADGQHEKIAVKDIFIQPDVAFCHANYWYIHPVELDYSYVCFLVCSNPHHELSLEEVDLLQVF